jgi:MFS family permease
MMFVAPSSARFVERFGARRVVTTGLSLVATGMLLMSTMGTDSPYWHFLGALIVLSLGMGLTMPPCTNLIMSSLPLGKAGVGSAVNDTTRELGGALGVAVLGSVLASVYTSHLGDATATLAPPMAAAARSSLGAALSIPGVPGLAHAARQAFIDGLGVATIIGACVAATGAVLVWRFLPDAHHLSTQTDETHAMPAEDPAR